MWIYVLKIILGLCLCKQANICITVLLHVGLRKSAPETGVKFLVFFTFFINFLMKTLIKNIVYCQTVSLNHLLMHAAKKLYVRLLSAFALNLSKSGNILFRKMPIGNCQLSIIVIGRRDNSPVSELCLSDGSCWATC